MKRHADAACDRLAVAHRGLERPLPDGRNGRLVEIGAAGLGDLGLRHVTVDVDREREEHDVGVLADVSADWRIDGVDMLDDDRRRYGRCGRSRRSLRGRGRRSRLLRGGADAKVATRPIATRAMPRAEAGAFGRGGEAIIRNSIATASRYSIGWPSQVFSRVAASAYARYLAALW